MRLFSPSPPLPVASTQSLFHSFVRGRFLPLRLFVYIAKRISDVSNGTRASQRVEEHAIARTARARLIPFPFPSLPPLVLYKVPACARLHLVRIPYVYKTIRVTCFFFHGGNFQSRSSNRAKTRTLSVST